MKKQKSKQISPKLYVFRIVYYSIVNQNIKLKI